MDALMLLTRSYGASYEVMSRRIKNDRILRRSVCLDAQLSKHFTDGFNVHEPRHIVEGAQSICKDS